MCVYSTYLVQFLEELCVGVLHVFQLLRGLSLGIGHIRSIVMSSLEKQGKLYSLKIIMKEGSLCVYTFF